MRAMVLTKTGAMTDNPEPLRLVDLPRPAPARDQLLVRVSVCGVCHTELDEIEGRLAPDRLPRVLGHQIVGRVEARGDAVEGFSPDDRVGIAWIYRACGACTYCTSGRENLCERFEATGRDADGGYAEFMTVDAAFAYHIPTVFTDVEAAPLLCAGAIGYRSLRLAQLEDGRPLGLTGFGASAHLVLMMAAKRYPRSPVFVFARRPEERAFARDLGAAWAGDTDEAPPAPLAAVIDTTPAWKPVVRALERLEPGGRLVINAIRKDESDKEWLTRLDYPTHLWREKSIMSVANVTRQDVREFLALAASIPIRPEVERYALADANRALIDLKTRRVRGGKVLEIGPTA
jgi:propanol-preferring alcohol dehydrogenase